MKTLSRTIFAGLLLMASCVKNESSGSLDGVNRRIDAAGSSAAGSRASGSTFDEQRHIYEFINLIARKSTSYGCVNREGNKIYTLSVSMDPSAEEDASGMDSISFTGKIEFVDVAPFYEDSRRMSDGDRIGLELFTRLARGYEFASSSVMNSDASISESIVSTLDAPPTAFQRAYLYGRLQSGLEDGSCRLSPLKFSYYPTFQEYLRFVYPKA